MDPVPLITADPLNVEPESQSPLCGSSFVGSLGSLPLPDSSSASQHLLLFISALIPKALASLLTSFTLALSGDKQVHCRIFPPIV